VSDTTGGPGAVIRWLKNVASGYASLLIDGLLFLVLTPLFVDRLGVEGYGLWVLATTVLFYLRFLDLGFEGAQIRFHARFAARERHDLVTKLTRTVTSALSAAGVVACVAALAIAAWPAILDDSATSGQIEELRVVLLLLAVDLLVIFPASALDNVYEGTQRIDLRNFRALVISLLKAGADVAVLLSGHGLVWLAAVEVLASCATLLFDLWAIPRLVPGLLSTRIGFDLGIWRRIRHVAIWNFFDDLLMSGFGRLGNLFVAGYMSIALLTPYALCAALTGLLMAAVSPITDTLLPLTAGLHARGRREELAQMVGTAMRGLVALVTPLTIILAVLGTRLIEWWVPEARGTVPPGLVALFAADAWMSVLLWVPTIALTAVNRVRALVFVTISEIALFAVLALFWVPRFELLGIGWAALVSNTVIGLGVLLPLAARALEVPLASLLGGAFLRIAAVSAAAAILATLVEAGNPGGQGGALLLHAAVIGIVTGFALLSLGATRRDRLDYQALWRTLRSA
jgi:O-antigen/teichoic acid export membrane protein